MKFRTRFSIIGVIVLLGFSVFFVLATMTLNKVMVNGPIYKTLARDKDLIADILPPSQFIV
jgi:methyl-accepting chemotaxis protein